MFRIDNPTAVTVLPVIPSVGVPGYFTKGNPATAVNATIVDDWWLNTVQEEILTVVVNAGLTPSKVDRTQLYQAIQHLISGGTGGGPDTDPYLPLTGGQLHAPGAGDLLNLYVDTGQNNRIIYTTGITRQFAVGLDPSGKWTMTDVTAGVIRFEIEPTAGNVAVASNFEVHGGYFFGRPGQPLGTADFVMRNANGTEVTIGAWDNASETMTGPITRFDYGGGFSNLTHLGFNAYKLGGGPWIDSASDERVKRSIEDYTCGLDAIRQLRPVTYQFNGLAELPDDDSVYHGFVAQEVIDIMPEMVGERRVKLRPDDEDETAIHTMNTGPLIYALVNAVKTLAARLDALGG